MIFDPTDLRPLLVATLPEGTPIVYMPAGAGDMVVSTGWTQDTIKPIYIDPVTGIFSANNDADPVRFVADTPTAATVRFCIALRDIVARECTAHVDPQRPVIVGFKNHSSDHFPCLYIVANRINNDNECVYKHVYSMVHLQTINQGSSSSDNESIASPSFE